MERSQEGSDKTGLLKGLEIFNVLKRHKLLFLLLIINTF